MLATRVIPCLLLKGSGLVKTVRFADPRYVGDPINAVKIFNEKEVDELIFLDISASREKREPAFEMIDNIASECFMPVAYGGGVRSVEQASRIVARGIEKIVLNTAALRDPTLITRLAERIGASSTVVGVDVSKDLFGRYRVYDHTRRKTTDHAPEAYAVKVAAAGAGEIFLNDVTRDGTGSGFDLDLIHRVSSAVNVPVIACGGAGGLEDLRRAAQAGASAVAAGSLFVYMGKHRAVMINYPPYAVLQDLFQHA